MTDRCAPDGVGHCHTYSANGVGGAGGWIGLFGEVAQLCDRGTQTSEVGDLPVDVGQSLVQQVAHMVAGCVPDVANVDHLPDLGQGQPGGRPRWMKSNRFTAS